MDIIRIQVAAECDNWALKYFSSGRTHYDYMWKLSYEKTERVLNGVNENEAEHTAIIIWSKGRVQKLN